jgi:hypothetical protein
MDEGRRNILKMFGIGAAAGVAGVATAAAGPIPETSSEAIAKAARKWVDPHILPFGPPQGMVYNWKRMFVTRDTPDMPHIVAMQEAGWKPVPMERHAEHFPEGERSYWIEVGGLVLMEKPAADIEPPRAFPLPEEARDELDPG